MVGEERRQFDVGFEIPKIDGDRDLVLQPQRPSQAVPEILVAQLPRGIRQRGVKRNAYSKFDFPILFSPTITA